MRSLSSVILTGLLLAGCSAGEELIVGDIPPGNPISYSIIYVVHADGDYLYFDRNRNARKADEKVLEEAKAIGESATGGELFIFHQLPESKIFGVFPKKNRRMYHYRNGRLVQRKSYSPSGDRAVLGTESSLYRTFSEAGQDDLPRYFLYFGHQIPETRRKGYYRSRPDAELDIALFAAGISDFLPSALHSFSLTVLSVCNGGNPLTVDLLQDQTEILLTSPQNLHLSHIDSDPLLQLERDSAVSAGQIATAMADTSFQRLSDFLKTPVILSIYRMEEVKPYLKDLQNAYQDYLGRSGKYPVIREYRDCLELPFADRFRLERGVQRWFKPAQFGSEARKSGHSGWGCIELSDSDDEGS